jgi:hypothetical protein
MIRILTDVTIVIRSTSNAIIWAILTGAVTIFIITGGAITGRSINSVSITG